ncbi:two-component system sensor histidine kinase NtrB [Gilvimarinus sp. 1_MG-2023]|uniref:two-component system sensor histidine kinase NtrB n=2 Tax=unclassified Gilvimarinus TaxID=2642066 RepID=UPI0026E46C95|nr:ATP-binding protein [Gilvimarinus sp. 1_MG-2023]MDO6571812.1 ATP-binding protein [Gilvimarinus sp. 2_MG-2023]MDO6745885.1 ATP-binding protein [Gilvimarinus sp. 1_MG-2023]
MVTSESVMASPSDVASDQRWLWFIIILLLALQTALIVGLQRSRLKITRARQALCASRDALEEQVKARTESLHNTNDQLYQEIGRHEATELLLRETQEYLHSIINSMPSIIIGVSHRGFITHWNAAAEKRCDIPAEQALRQHILDVYPTLPIQSATIAETINAGTPYITENFQELYSGDTRFCDLTIYPLIAAQSIGAVIRIDDVTMRVRVENMMIQNEKMLSLGELAAGMAHEINNPLSTILHGVQNIYRRTSPELPANQVAAHSLGLELDALQQYFADRKVSQFLEDIREAGERSADIVTNMLDFSRHSNQRPQPYDLGHVISHGISLLKAEPSPLPDLVVDIDQSVPDLIGCAAEIQQVLLNLVRNAAQALGPNLDNQAKIFIQLQQKDDNAILTVKDNGPGMPEEVTRHIFEPFFTTKEIGLGTGLGLSVSYFIITEHHGGSISVNSTLGEGTEFVITLPLSKPATESTHNSAHQASPE